MLPLFASVACAAIALVWEIMIGWQYLACRSKHRKQLYIFFQGASLPRCPGPVEPTRQTPQPHTVREPDWGWPQRRSYLSFLAFHCFSPFPLYFWQFEPELISFRQTFTFLDLNIPTCTDFFKLSFLLLSQFFELSFASKFLLPLVVFLFLCCDTRT